MSDRPVALNLGKISRLRTAQSLVFLASEIRRSRRGGCDGAHIALAFVIADRRMRGGLALDRAARYTSADFPTSGAEGRPTMRAGRSDRPSVHPAHRRALQDLAGQPEDLGGHQTP